MGKIRKLGRTFRKQLGDSRQWSSVTLVNVEELKMILDRLEKLEKRDKKRKAHDASMRPTVLEPTVPTEIVVGSRVELVADVQTFYWPFMVKGARGTVRDISQFGAHRYSVAYDADTGQEGRRTLWTKRDEIRPVA